MQLRQMLRKSGRAAWVGEWMETIESRLLLSGAFDAVGLTALRSDAAFAGIDGSGVGIAVLDTGTFSNHPDLSPNFVKWYDAVLQTEGNAPFDPNGHGTHVAGTAAGRNPDIGVATQARLIGIRALPDENERQPRHDTVADGLQWVIDNHATYNIRVVNMSLGTRQNFNSVPSTTSGEAALIRRLEQLGITVVTASGNSYADFAAPGAAAPAVFSTLSVASTWEDNGAGDSFPMFAGGGGPFAAFEREGVRDRLAASSQRSTLANQVAAPGQTIFSAWNNDGGQLYNTISGTSMASPLVAGMVALMQDAAKTFGGRFLSTTEVVSIVKDTADTIIDAAVATNGRIRISDRQVFDLPETGASFKRVNIYNAIRKVRMLLTGSMEPGPVAGDVDNTTTKAIQLGKTDGSTNIGAEGSVGSDGTINSGAMDVDLYRFELASRGELTVSLTNTAGGTAFDSLLRLFNAAGGQIAINDDIDSGNLYSRIATGVLEPGVYYVGVSASGNDGYNATSGAGAVDGLGQGDYQMIVSLSNPDPNGVATGAVVTDKLPTFRAGRIGSDLGVPVGAADVDFFLVTAPDNGVLRIDVDSSPFGLNAVDAVLRVFDENFNQIAFNDDRATGDIDPLLVLTLAKGQRVYVAVADFANRDFDPHDPFSRVATGTGGDYDLTLSFDNRDANGTVFDAAQRSLGGAVVGTIGSDGGVSIGADGSKDVDFFELTTTSAGVLDLFANSPDGTLRISMALWVYDASADDVVRVGESLGATASLRAFVSSGETYYVSITGEGNSDFDWFAPATGTGGDTGNYSFDARVRAFAFARTRIDDSVANATPVNVVVGSQVQSEIGADGGFLLGGADVDIFRFTAVARQRIVIRTLANAEDSTDTVLRVFNASGAQIAINDDVSATDRGSRVSLIVEAGQTIYIGVNGYSVNADAYDVISGEGAAVGVTGAYVLRLEPAAGPEVDVAGSTGVSIASGDMAPVLADGTRFGAVSIDGGGAGGVIVRQFTIFNTGNRRLNLTGAARIAISGANAGDFAVVAQPAGFVAANRSLTFSVRFNPSDVGVRRAVVTIASNDLDEGSYSFAVDGTGLERPEIDVRSSGGGSLVSIASGDTTPRVRDGTSFGVRTVGQQVSRTFRIFNTGRKLLNLNGTPRIQISGDAAADFVVIANAPASVRRGASAAFTLRFAASAAGLRSATVTILSNDPDERTYTFLVSGVGAT